jgi:NAD(P)-dependent dehydrogenase (short-subunit alcohol dehydrogenase family)
VQRCVEKIANDFGSVDFLINCAGISRSSLIVDTSVEEWEKVFAINTRSVFLFSRDVAKLMIKNRVSGGRIVIISSQASKIGELGNGAYCASKAALNSLTQVLGLELAKYGIAVSALCPGYVDTEMMQKVFRERGPIEGMTAEQYRDKLLSNVPNGRMVHPDEIAGLVDYLCGEGAAPITGVTITIAGGQTLI